MLRRFISRNRTYLDWASAAPVHPSARAAFTRTLSLYGNPSSPHEEGRKARAALVAARASIAKLAGVKAQSVVFTSGATESNNLAIVGRVRAAREKGISTPHILYLSTMHSSVVHTLKVLQEEGVECEELPVVDGRIDLDAFSHQLRPETVLVCVDAVCGETGIRYDTLRMKRALEALRSTALVHVDASQLPLAEPIERTRLGADLLTLDAQKVGGIRGIGALIVAAPRSILPLMQGGGQEGGLRPGTEPVALAAAFAEALQVCSQEHAAFAKRAAHDRDELLDQVMKAVPDVQVNEGRRQVPHILNLSFPGFDTDYLVALLDRKGFSVATKSACETDSPDGSRAVRALTGDASRAQSTVRISWGPQTRDKELLKLPAALARITTFLRS